MILGGLFVDLKALELKADDYERGCKNFQGGENTVLPTFYPDDPVVIEWRALTVSLLDLVAEDVRKKLSVDQTKLPLFKILEAGTWKVFYILL